jgi:Tol biopolymer transport system component
MRAMRLEVTTPPTVDLVGLAISPDGTQLVYVAMSDGMPRLWLRSLNGTTARPLPGTDFAEYPFWSPDSRSVGFFADGKMKRVDLDGGSPQVLAVASNPRGGLWAADGTILFGAGGANPIFRVRATPGGAPQLVTRLRTGEQSHRFPQVLPGGRFLYYVIGSPNVRGVHVAALDGSNPVRLRDADTTAVYAVPGRLLFVLQGTLFAQNFDATTLALSGDPFPVAQQVARDPLSIQIAAVSASAAGPIVYRSGGVGIPRRLVWFDRNGRDSGPLGGSESTGVNNPVMSADGRHAAWDRTSSENVDIWTMDLQAGNPDRLTSTAVIDAYPIWSPDGRRLLFGSIRGAAMNLYARSITSSAEDESVLVTPEAKAPTDWSSDGRFVMYRSSGRETGYDLWALPMNADGPGKPFPVVQTAFDERDGQFSPDGRWVAFQSNESDRTEIYIQRFPTPGRKIRISPNGGAQPRWNRTGTELFYISLDGRLMAVPLEFRADSDATKMGAQASLFHARLGSALHGAARQQYMTSPDGQRFLINTVTDESQAPVTIILNWTGAPEP